MVIFAVIMAQRLRSYSYGDFCGYKRFKVIRLW